MDVKINIKVNVRFLRKKHDYTQQQFADSVKIKRSNLGAYEEGRAAVPIEVLAEISKCYSVSLDTLVFTNMKLAEEMNSQ